MKILYIWDADYPWDIRVEKICSSLKKNGAEVHIAARNLNKLEDYEIFYGIHIHRIRKLENNFANYTISFPLFFSPIWKKLINQIIERYGINLIIVRDLPMAIAGIWAGRKYNLPVIFDMAEDYCAMIRVIWKNNKFKGINFIIRNPYFAKIVEKYSLNKFSHIIVVVEEARDYLLKKGISQERISIIGNTPMMKNIENYTFNKGKDFNSIKNSYSVIYTGGITADRGIEVMINAIPHVIDKIPNILFVIIGNGNAVKDIVGLIAKKGLDKYVKWIGWVENKFLYDFIRVSKIGLIPHYATDHTNTTIPNKIFDYMACGIPVIASNALPMQRIIDEEKCGITFRSGDSKELAKAIIQIYNNECTYGMNGLKAVKSKYNWEIEEKKIKTIIELFE